LSAGEYAQAEILGARASVSVLRAVMMARFDALKAFMAKRLAKGHVHECHGDLHARNIVRLQGRFVAFDCMEFEPSFRWIDVAEEIAFLLADLDARGHALHAHAFLVGYLAQSGDYAACRVLNLYKAHHAVIRAKVTALSAADATNASVLAQTRSQHDSYVDTARHSLEQKQPVLVLMSGLSGSGKTWLASRLAAPLAAIHLRSDVERKRSAGLTAQARSRSAIEQGMYSRETSARVYAHLASCAEDVLSGGYTAIVDATFGRRDDRANFSRLASRLGVELCLIQCHAPLDTLRARVTQRHAEGRDASEADLAVLQWQAAHWEPVFAEEGFGVIEVDTTKNLTGESFTDLLARVRPAVADEHRAHLVARTPAEKTE